MALPGDMVTEPVPISLISGRYLLFDVNVATYLRRNHHICGVLSGSIPQIPQQNVFLGLPVELLPEEAKFLAERKVAYIVDDAAWHREKFVALKGDDRKQYLEYLRSEGRKARILAEEMQQKRAELGLAKQAMLRASKDPAASKEPAGVTAVSEERSSSPAPSSTTSVPPSAPYTLTPTTTYAPLPISQNQSQQADPPVPASYPLFSHLHDLDYFTTPGLRFGCDYTVYPGDPLRFHSHFLAVGYGWEDEIPLIDLIGGGRLGTGVKKGFLIGGESPATEKSAQGDVRTFCIEWGGM